MKAFVVLGMHGAATSLVAEGLARAGVFMGRVILVSPTEDRMLWEHEPLVALNERLLAQAGGAWDDPPPREAIDALDDTEAREYCEERSDEGAEMWGWKGPRTSLTFPLYELYLGDDPHLVCVFRKPDKIAATLSRRDGTPLADNRRLADEYHARILEHIERFLDA